MLLYLYVLTLNNLECYENSPLYKGELTWANEKPAHYEQQTHGFHTVKKKVIHSIRKNQKRLTFHKHKQRKNQEYVNP